MKGSHKPGEDIVLESENPNDAHLLNKIARMLNKGGKILIRIDNEPGVHVWQFDRRPPTHVRLFVEEETACT